MGHPSPPIWPCSNRGLPCRKHYCLRGELLPRRFTLTGKSRRRFVFCGTVHHHLHGVQVLPGGLPSGARTFLDGIGIHRDHPIAHTRAP
jgi:hypothetical protein